MSLPPQGGRPGAASRENSLLRTRRGRILDHRDVELEAGALTHHAGNLHLALVAVGHLLDQRRHRLRLDEGDVRHQPVEEAVGLLLAPGQLLPEQLGAAGRESVDGFLTTPEDFANRVRALVDEVIAL